MLSNNRVLYSWLINGQWTDWTGESRKCKSGSIQDNQDNPSSTLPLLSRQLAAAQRGANADCTAQAARLEMLAWKNRFVYEKSGI